MSKYVCDYDQLLSVAKSLCSLGNELETNVSTYASNMTANLSSWNGSAKKNFIKQCNGQVDLATRKAQETVALGNFIQNAVEEIQKTEQELAQLTI